MRRKQRSNRGKNGINAGMKRRRRGLLGLWALSLLSISLYGGAVSYGFFFGVTLIPVVSAVYLLAVYLRFKIYQRLESRNMVCGQPVPYLFVLQNDDWFAFTSVSVRLFSSFSYVEELPDDVEYELLPGDRFTYKTRLVCKYRGEYEVGVKEVVITDFLRLFQVSYRVPATIKALVKPRIVRVSELNCIADVSALLQREAFMAQTEADAVVRDYVPGDALKQIHWKATAREQKLKVRKRTGEEKAGITILCDTKRYARDNRVYLPLENKMLEVLLAIGIFLSERNMAYEVCYSQRGMVRHRVRSVKDFDAFYRQVSDMEFREEEEMQEVCRQTMAEGIWQNGRIVFLVLHEWDASVWRMTEQLEAGGVIVVICLITDENVDQYRRYSSIRKRIVVIPVEAQLEGRL